MMNAKLLGLLTGAVILFSIAPANAQWNPGGTESEQALLPRFCVVKLRDDNTSAEARTFIRQFGFDNWLHLHHYCYGLNAVNRSLKAGNLRDRNAQLQLAVGEYGYVLRNARPDFWMRPQLNVELGRILARLDRKPEAMSAFQAALQANPAYLAGYLALIEHLRSSGLPQQAREAAAEGLRHLPEAQRLQALYLELGGKRPFPVPIVRTAPAPSKDASAPEVEEGLEETERPSGEVAVEVRENDRGGSTQEADSARKCRFCPPEEVERRWQESFN